MVKLCLTQKWFDWISLMLTTFQAGTPKPQALP